MKKRSPEIHRIMLLWFFGLVQLLMVAGVDFMLGPRFSSSIFYFFPLLFFAFFLGRRAAIIAAFIASILWFVTDAIYVSFYTSHLRLLWNSFVRFIIFFVVAYAVSGLIDKNRELRNKNRDLEKSNAEILRLSKTKSQFTSSVSHEIRTPMAIIKESISMLLEGFGGSLTADQRRYLETTNRSVDRLIRLINDILDFAKFEEGKSEFFFQENDLNKLIPETVACMIPLAKTKDLELVFESSQKESKVTCDTDAIVQVLTNIIGNAIKFTEKGKITVNSTCKNGEVMISVTDQGPGIKKSELHRVFEPFEQILPESGKKVKGTGLGMAISKHIVEKHQGTIGVESDAETKKGTTFYFTLPTNIKAVVSSQS